MSLRTIRSKYPTCSTVDALESVSSGSIVRLENWYIQSFGDSSFSLMDKEGHHLKIHYSPHLLKLAPFAGVHNIPLIHVKVYRPDDYDYYAWARSKFEVYYHELRPGKCTCGAAYTFLSHLHSDWCDSHIQE